jgi:DNA-binding PadR family transcriptional regulator
MALSDGPGHGYELIQRLELRSGGRWRPSPGSVYPTLQLLEDEGFAEASEQDGKRVYSVTETGREEMTRRTQRPDGSPWAFRGEEAGEHEQLRAAFGQLAMAYKQIAAAGKVEHVTAATEVLNEARRKLYQLLAEA